MSTGSQLFLLCVPLIHMFLLISKLGLPSPWSKERMTERSEETNKKSKRLDDPNLPFLQNLPHTSNCHKSIGHFMQLYYRMIPRISAFLTPCDLEWSAINSRYSCLPLHKVCKTNKQKRFMSVWTQAILIIYFKITLVKFFPFNIHCAP